MNKNDSALAQEILEEIAHIGGSCDLQQLLTVAVSARRRLTKGKAPGSFVMQQLLMQMGINGMLDHAFTCTSTRVTMAGGASEIADFKARRAAAIEHVIAAGAGRLRDRSLALADKMAMVQQMLEVVASDPLNLDAMAGLEHSFTQLSTELTRVRRDAKALGAPWC